VRPKRPATVVATVRPTFVEPVNETSGTRLSSSMLCPTSRPEPMHNDASAPKPSASSTGRHAFVIAIAHRGVRLDGFHKHASPHTSASIEFQAHTATGKLKAVMIPTVPSGCHCSRIVWPARSECIESP
jgi:hypothetical protein